MNIFGLEAATSTVDGEPILIRPAEDADGESVVRLFQSHLNWINVNYPPEAVFHRVLRTDGVASSLRSFPAAVAEGEDRIIGFCITRPIEPFMLEIRQLYVDDPYRRRGLGQLLLAQTEEVAWERGFRVMFGTASAHWYPGKTLPTRVFETAEYEITEIDEGLEMYMKRRPNPGPLQLSLTSNGLPDIQRFDYNR